MNNVWAIGFRPFFLTGSIVSLFLVLYWAIVFFMGALPDGFFSPVNWHAHEMVYGFAVSIVAGFLLTASANWTMTKALNGKKLAILFFLWFLGRLGMTLSLFNLPIPHFVYSTIDMLFIPALVAALAPPLIKAKQLRNMQFIPVLLLLAVGNLLTHLSALELMGSEYATRGIYLGVNIILIIMIIIGGRIVPAFTANALLLKISPRPWLEKAVLISVWIFVFMDFTGQTLATAWIALIAGVLNWLRLSGWGTLRTLKNPLLWILHLGYFWIGAGFILIFISEILGFLPRSVAIHAFTAGAMGTFIIGMMSRVSLGHSGRPLKLKKGFVVSYYLITFAATIRVALGFFPEVYAHGILCAGILWALSFLWFLIYYATILISPRADGKPG